MAEGKTIFRASVLQVGDKVGAYTLLFTYREEQIRYWIMRCDICLRERRMRDLFLKRYVNRGCMCLGTRQHGMSDTREYTIWRHMIARCYNPKYRAYRWYGAIGRYVCQRWRDSCAAFLEDVGRSPTVLHSIDRIDTTGSYTCGQCRECTDRNQPLNVRWATKDVQTRNCISNLWFYHNGETKILKDWCRDLGLNYRTVHKRIYSSGMSFEKAIQKSDFRRKLRQDSANHQVESS